MVPKVGMPYKLSARHRRGAGKSRDIARPRCQEPCFGAMCAAQPEIDQQLAGGRQQYSRRLRRNQRLEMQDVNEPCFRQLCFRQWRR